MAVNDIAPSSFVTAFDHEMESVLLGMLDHGRPSVSHLSEGWHCSIDMNVSAEGSTFKIRSEFGHKTPMAAVRECVQRMNQALRKLGGR